MRGRNAVDNTMVVLVTASFLNILSVILHRVFNETIIIRRLKRRIGNMLFMPKSCPIRVQNNIYPDWNGYCCR